MSSYIEGSPAQMERPLKRKSQHPADIDAMAAIVRARAFTASLFLGAGKFAHSPESPSLAGARHWGVLLQRRHRGGRRALVYALLANGRSVHIPDTCHPRSNLERTMTEKTYSNRSNAQRAAKAELGADAVNGVDFTVYEAKSGRFAWKRGRALERAAAGKPVKAALAKAPRAPKEKEKMAKPLGKLAAIEVAAAEGKLPAPPDFAAATHTRYRGKLAEVVAMAEAGDLKRLKAYQINPISTSPRAIDRYRNLCITALRAREAHTA